MHCVFHIQLSADKLADSIHQLVFITKFSGTSLSLPILLTLEAPYRFSLLIARPGGQMTADSSDRDAVTDNDR